MVPSYVFIFIFSVHFASCDVYKIGVGIADVTGPAAEVNMMGYAQLEQNTAGIHTRLFSRAFIIGDNERRVVFVSVDLGMISQIINLEVIKSLRAKYGDVYTEKNVCLSGTHTHSGPGGFLQFFMYLVPSLGFVKDNFMAIVAGIVKSIDMAHNNLKDGYIYWNEGELYNASISRSPTSYLNNRREERDQYEYNVDKNMMLLKLTDLQRKPIGMINWFAVHGTSMNNTNKLISSDNKGYASILFEQDMNVNSLIGKGPFVSAFAQANEGDVSPNILGAHCIDTGLPCDNITSTCNGNSNKCVASGPGKDMFESTKIIGRRQYSKAKELFDSATNELSGPVQYIHQYVDMTKVVIPLNATHSVTTCKPAMGYSFAAGTTDGPGGLNFEQGTNSSNFFINFIRNLLLQKPSEAMTTCQFPKPILLPTGEMNIPYKWQPNIVPLQILKIGDLAIVAVPGEFTTMSGRRIRNAVKEAFDENLPNKRNTTKVVIAGLSNIYTSYITTFEEYQVQRYEGGSTIYGPHTLSAYRQQFKFLATNLARNKSVSAGPSPPNLLQRQMNSLRPGVLYDGSAFKSFGSVRKDVRGAYKVGETASVTFVGAHPRNNFQMVDSFLIVERNNGTSSVVVATDANWETKYHWKRRSVILATSDVTVTWDIPAETKPGIYRIRHHGYRKTFLGRIKPYKGVSAAFKVL